MMDENMDLEEWEILPEDGTLQAHDDDGKLIFSRKYNGYKSNSDLNMNHFKYPTQNPPELADQPKTKRLPLPVRSEPVNRKALHQELLNAMLMKKIKAQQNIRAEETDQETVSQENQFVDKKLDSPIYPRFNERAFEFEEGKTDYEKESYKDEILSKKISSNSDSKTEVSWEEKNGCMDIWKRGLSGIGAICSFGVAAATFCIVASGNHNTNKQLHQQTQTCQVQIKSEGKGKIKQVVLSSANLKEAISSARRVRKAQISVGGYYDGF